MTYRLGEIIEITRKEHRVWIHRDGTAGELASDLENVPAAATLMRVEELNEDKGRVLVFIEDRENDEGVSSGSSGNLCGSTRLEGPPVHAHSQPGEVVRAEHPLVAEPLSE